MEDNQVIISSKRYLKATISFLVFIYAVYVFIIIFGFVAFTINGVNWINYIYVIIVVLPSLSAFTFFPLLSYKSSKIILENDEIIISYPFFFILFFGTFKHRLKLSEIIRYEKHGSGFLIPYIVNKKISEKKDKRTTKFVYNNRIIAIPDRTTAIPKNECYTKEQFMDILTKFSETGTRIRETGKITAETTTMMIYRSIFLAYNRYTNEQLMYILTHIRENGGLQGDAYDNALNQLVLR